MQYRLSHISVFKMVGQGKISEFFIRAGVKRNLSDETLNKEETDTKKPKLTPDPIEVPTENDVLSQELSDRIEENRTRAKIKLQAKKTTALANNIGTSWFKALEPEFSKPYFLKLSEFMKNERKKYTIYPSEDAVFTWTTLCDIKQIKVVMIGQDPYHNPGQAHGLCFSVQEGVPFPPSLVNIFKELKTDLVDFEIPTNGNLTEWAKQGVLLLNACLTVRAHNANSHKDQGWEILTDAVIKWINDNLTNVVFLLWGSYAQKKASFVNKKKHHVLKCPHPSPLSSHRGFFGCKHFSQTNELLVKDGRQPINWNLNTPKLLS
uniref:Uracil-DNA glycosylase n=1 Tax=Strigamia maritima TaxID=126957 RepID=T1J0F3_STRMM